jgi:hypothetical protein
MATLSKAAVTQTAYVGLAHEKPLSAVTRTDILRYSPDGDISRFNPRASARLTQGERALHKFVTSDVTHDIPHRNIHQHVGGWWKTKASNGASNPTTADGEFSVMANLPVAAGGTTTLYIRGVDASGVSASPALVGAVGSSALFALRGAVFHMAPEDLLSHPAVLFRVDSATATPGVYNITVLAGTLPHLNADGVFWKFSFVERFYATTLLSDTGPNLVTTMLAEPSVTFAHASDAPTLLPSDVSGFTGGTELLFYINGAFRHVHLHPLGPSNEYILDTTIGMLANVDTSADSATDGQALVWNSTTSLYEPRTLVFELPAPPQVVAVEPNSAAVGSQNLCASRRLVRDFTYVGVGEWAEDLTSPTTGGVVGTKPGGMKILAATDIGGTLRCTRCVAAYVTGDSVARRVFVEYTVTTAVGDTAYIQAEHTDTDVTLVAGGAQGATVTLRVFGSWTDATNRGGDPATDGTLVEALLAAIPATAALTIAKENLVSFSSGTTATIAAAAGGFVAFGGAGGGSTVNAVLQLLGNRVVMKWAGGAADTIALQFGSVAAWSADTYLLRSRIENSNATPPNLRYTVSAPTNAGFQKANGTATMTASTVFTQADVDAGSIFVKIANLSIVLHSYSLQVDDLTFNATSTTAFEIPVVGSRCAVSETVENALIESRVYANGVATNTSATIVSGDTIAYTTSFSAPAIFGFTQSSAGEFQYVGAGDAPAASALFNISLSVRLYGAAANVRLFAYVVKNGGATEIAGSRCVSYSPVSTTFCEVGGQSTTTAILALNDTVSVVFERAAGGAATISVEALSLVITRA